MHTGIALNASKPALSSFVVYILEALSIETVLRTQHCRGAFAPAACQPSELPPFGMCSLDKWANLTSKECNTAAHGTS